MKKFVKETLDEEAMGGVSAPMATLNNTPGVGTATPAASAGSNTDGPSGSGDSWGDSSIAMATQKTNENNLNPYDKIGAMMAKKMGVKQPFKKKDGRTNTVKQNEVDENAQLSPSFSLPTLDQYEKACKHVPDHPLTTKKKKVNEGEKLRDDNALKDVKAKEALGDLGIAFKFKPGKSGKDRVFITDPMKVVLDKIKQGEWEDYGKNPENTIRKFEKGGKILAIYADGKDLPRATVTNKVEVTESIQIRKVVSNSLDPYVK